MAFVKEESALTAAETVLPDRPVSQRINLVTETGLRKLEQELAHAQQALEAANAIEDVDERRRQSAVPLRDLRYLSKRVQSAQLCQKPASNDLAAFGHSVTFERDDGRTQTYQIVGEDEANPSKGTVSHASPLATALLGKRIGDVAILGDSEVEIVSLE